MSEDKDYLYALEMQKRWNNESSDDDVKVDFKVPPYSKKIAPVKRSNPHSNLDPEFLNRTQNLVHPQWEMLDPTPDIFALFGAFDAKFFQSRLKCVTLEWSKRMYSCAGICYSRRNNFGMDVTIRLSEPLLKLRPRKDLVETMLHEMIHAYCFVLHIREGNGGHGPNFKKIMYGINKVAGTNITVYHTFSDEVNVYKQHWWRCNGSCQHRSPFFGYVKRSCNRAPGPNDQWWSAHVESCGGTFMKIKGPEKPKKKSAKENEKSSTEGDLRKFLIPTKTSNTSSSASSNINGFSNFNSGTKGATKSNGGGTMLLNPKTKRPSNTLGSNSNSEASGIATAFPPTSYPGLSSDPFNENVSRNKTNQTGNNFNTTARPAGNLQNVVGFRDLNDSNRYTASGVKDTPKMGMMGQGYSFNSNNKPESEKSAKGSGISNDGIQVDRNHLRNIWANKFGGTNSGNANSNKNGDSKIHDLNTECNRDNKSRGIDDPSPRGDNKRRRISEDDVICIAEDNKSRETDWVVLDDDVMLRDHSMETITIASDDDSDSSDDIAILPRTGTKAKPVTSGERQIAIKKEILDDSNDLKDEDIMLIDDDYNDDEDLQNISAAVELADTSVIEEFFGEDTLLKEFKRENDVIPTSSRYVSNPDNDIITCPICQGKMKRTVLAEHLDGCGGIAIKIEPPKYALKKLSATSRQVKPRQSRASRHSAKDILRNAGYSEEDLLNITSNSSTEEEEFLNSTCLNSPAQQPSGSPSISIDLNSPDESSRRYRQRNLFKTTRQCPACAKEIEEDEMNEHLDECLMK